jgi:Holliday junction DNA helicase RuvA
MYEYIQGELQTVSTDHIVIDVRGIGYKICTPKTEKSRALNQGAPLKLYTDLIIREDSHTLYGFSSSLDRDFFRLLLQVNGIGPKVAINIMSSTSATQLATALHNKDTSILSKIPGIGKKLADRLILELHEKISSLYEPGTYQIDPATTLGLDASKALQTLGLPAHEAREIISRVQSLHPQVTTVEGMVQHALILKRGSKK